jgi:hypothetical protein
MNARFGGPGGVYLPSTKQELSAVMSELNVSAGEAVVRLLERGNFGIIARFGIEADLVKILQHPATSVACDCGAVAGEAQHPRYYGTFPRVLGRYVREQNALTLEDAVRKMTGLPASTIGLVDRGLLTVGMFADVTAFDPGVVIDHATFEEPMRPSDGIWFVVVNGRVVVRDGKVTGEQAGRPLFRTERMPTRPMSGGRRVLKRRGHVETAEVTLDLLQDPKSRRASGVFRLVDPRAKVSIDMKDFGSLQAMGGWASFTGRARLRSSEAERAVTVIVDDDDLVVSAEEYQLSGTIGR